MHRQPALALLAAHAATPLAPDEAAMTAAAVAFAHAHPDCLLRPCLTGHLTGSAWVVDPTRVWTLLTHHRKLDRWLQPGGHADGGPDLLAVALSEAREESGLHAVAPLSPALFDVDRHWIPERPGEPGHWHHDLRFLLLADRAAPLVVSSESNDLAWVRLTDVTRLDPESSLARMVRKTLDSIKVL